MKDLIGPDTKITWSGTDGTVVGQIKKLEEWNEWGAPDGGHFFPVELDSQYEGKSITVEGVDVPTKTEKDRMWILKVDSAYSQNKKFTFKVEGEEIFKLDVSKAELAP